MRRAALLLLLSLVALSCGGTGAHKACPASYANAITYMGEVRYGWHVADNPGPWPPVERRVSALTSYCGEYRSTKVIQFRGIAPEVALAADSADDGKPYTLYLSPGFLTEVRTHPLHDILYPPRQPDESRGSRAEGSPAKPGSTRRCLRTASGGSISGPASAPLWHGVAQPRAEDRVLIAGVLCGRTRKVARLIAVING